MLPDPQLRTTRLTRRGDDLLVNDPVHDPPPGPAAFWARVKCPSAGLSPTLSRPAICWRQSPTWAAAGVLAVGDSSGCSRRRISGGLRPAEAVCLVKTDLVLPSRAGARHFSTGLALRSASSGPTEMPSHLAGSVGCRSWWGSLSGWCRTSCGNCSSEWCRRLPRGLRVVDGAGMVTGKCWPRSCSRPRRAARGSSCLISGANLHDSQVLIPLVKGIPPIRSRRGRRRRKPGKLHADRGYDYSHVRRWLRERGITHRIARKGSESSTRLGRHRWTIERTMSWLAGCRRRHRRYERKAESSPASASIACTLICYRRLAK